MRLRSPVATKNRPSTKGFVTLVGWVCFLLWTNIFGCSTGFTGSQGFPLPYLTWRDYGPPFGFSYPWAIPVDIAFAVVSIGLIVFAVYRR